MTKIKCRLTLVTHQWTFLINIGYIHTFLILTNSSFYITEPPKGTDYLQKSLDGIFILPDKVSFMSWALLCLHPLPGKPLATFLMFQKHLLLAENECAFTIIQSAVLFRPMRKIHPIFSSIVRLIIFYLFRFFTYFILNQLLFRGLQYERIKVSAKWTNVDVNERIPL